MKKIDAGVVVGSDSDLPVIVEATNVLEELGIEYSISVASAHRTPLKVKKFIESCEKNGAKVFIAGAGMAAALPGVVAAETVCPVIGVPLVSKHLDGMDALLSISQMPPGIPVATVALGKAGAKNAGILAAEILAVGNKALKNKLQMYRKKMALAIESKDKELQKIGIKGFISKTGK